MHLSVCVGGGEGTAGKRVVVCGGGEGVSVGECVMHAYV